VAWYAATHFTQVMNPYELKARFAGQITLHGAVDIQGWLQRATPATIEGEVNRLIDEVGALRF